MRSILVAVLLISFCPGIVLAQPVQYDESIDGDIPFIEGTGWPLTLNLAPGENTVTGVLTKTPEFTDQDGFNVVVPDGAQIDSIQYEYATTFYVNSGVASYNFYLDGAVSPAPFENVRVSETLSDTRDFYVDVMPLGPGQYRIGRQGSAINSENEYDVAYTYTITVSGDDPEPPQITEVLVPFQRTGPVLDGEISLNEWSAAPQISLANGSITVVHDFTRLYFLVNMREDRSDNAFRDGGPDQVMFLADIDEDETITPNLDRRYRMLENTGNFRYETFTSSGNPPFAPPAPSTFSALAEGFGCFVADGSATLIPSLSCDNHRVWEVGLDLLELQASGDKTVRLGLLVQTEANQVETLPQVLSNFTAFASFELQGDTALTVGGIEPEEPLDELELHVTQGIQTPANSMDLVAERDTFVYIRISTDSGPIEYPILTLFASRDGIDLPGSPFTNRTSMGRSVASSGPYFGNWRMILDAADVGGNIEFDLVARQPKLQTTTGGPAQTVSFIDTVTPTYWIVPIDSGSTAEELPTEDYLTRQESETSFLLPVADVDFVRRPVITANPPTKDDADALVNQLYQQTLLGWTLGVLVTGEAPFVLPDQIIGAFAESKGGFGTTIGRAYARWVDGTGQTLWIKETPVEAGPILVHEINHNLDLDTDGTWGRHVRGCGAASTDPQWPYGISFEIQETGWLTAPVIVTSNLTLLPPRFVSSETPDYMSYCRADDDDFVQQDYPYQWVSPYRWQRQLDNVFRAVQPLTLSTTAVLTEAPPVQDVLYIMGGINIDGSGYLDPVLRQPGIVRAEQRAGDYAVRLVDCSGVELTSRSFGASFVGVEGDRRNTSVFEMTLPDFPSLCSIEVRRGDTLIAEREVTPNAPEVALLMPNGGENWDGNVTVSWAAVDADGDPLTAWLFYSPDAGATWLPVIGNLTDTEVFIDSTGLPGSTEAILRIIVSDGVNTVHDDSDGLFTVAPKPPKVRIIGPDADTTLFAGERQRFEGLARDAAGNRLPADGFRWTLNGEGAGFGNPLELVLEEGTQQLRLAVTTDKGLVGEAALELQVLGFDSDGDGVPDETDSCPQSETSPTVYVNGCASQVENRVTAAGCTVNDIVQEAFDTSEPGARTARAVVRALRGDEVVSQREWLDIQLCLRPRAALDALDGTAN